MRNHSKQKEENIMANAVVMPKAGITVESCIIGKMAEKKWVTQWQ